MAKSFYVQYSVLAICTPRNRMAKSFYVPFLRIFRKQQQATRAATQQEVIVTLLYCTSCTSPAIRKKMNRLLNNSLIKARGGTQISLLRRAASSFTHVYLDHWRLEEEDRTMVVPAANVFELQNSIAVHSGLSLPAESLTVYESMDKKQVLALADQVPIRESNNPLYVAVALTMKEQKEQALEQAEQALRQAALEGAKAFASAIMHTKKEVISKASDPAGKIEVLRDIPHLAPAQGKPVVSDIVIRECVEKVWTIALEKVQSEPMKRAMAVVGNPGIGKSHSIRYAIAKILKMAKTVTVLKRRLKEDGWYYQLVPGDDGSVTCSVYPEKNPVALVPTMGDPESFLIVDPGQTKTSCNFVESISAKLIIVPSPDSRHWGGNEFTKTRTDLRVEAGQFVYVPAYTLPQLLVVVPHLQGAEGLLPREIKERFYHLGGNLRRILSLKEEYDSDVRDVEREVQSFPESVAMQLALGHFQVDFSRDKPSSLTVGIEASDDLLQYSPKAQSRYAVECIAKKARKGLWHAAMSNERHGDAYLEEFLAILLTTRRAYYECRACVGKKDAEYSNPFEDFLGAAQESSKSVEDMGTSIRDEETIKDGKTRLLKSWDLRHPLFDMIYRKDDVYYAFNTTKSQKVKSVAATFTQLMDELVAKLRLEEDNRSLRLYYATSTQTFDDFVTAAAKPKVESPLVQLFHLHLVENPSENHEMS